MTAGSGRVTQAQVARLAGVSQAVVSMVLNGSDSLRITPETRERVQQVLRTTGYTVDIMGRRLRGGSNQILGVFTYESVFPSGVADFYRPFLLGIEEEAEAQGFDLLLFTSGGRRDGRRRIYDHGTNRLRIADGSILLGRHNDPQELAQLVEEQFPFVFVGRRESPTGPISYVGADYVAATREVHERLWALGHRRIGLLSVTEENEPTLDRRAGYEAAARKHRRTPLVFLEEDPAIALRQVRDEGVTALLVEKLGDGRRDPGVRARRRARCAGRSLHRGAGRRRPVAAAPGARGAEHGHGLVDVPDPAPRNGGARGARPGRVAQEPEAPAAAAAVQDPRGRHHGDTLHKVLTLRPKAG
ncbi:LacI family DNA-binding transcriptional regulator [Amycolatopsis nalaikhensis]|uniref:LacI family DNA-binding transcriptional regulator n=1 Tax=Amycolatopsis nalaikhensis TaxID=715472 RepID=A0ABY8Y180_9PSEU|nr:LacI family DNA-binding transcriptional regulator [Amycolatopsis sp. 2-2]WIV61623.1 LacI family DNA-binding transcriptional regulator [Amycolatopsis sp. 2-2]